MRVRRRILISKVWSRVACLTDEDFATGSVAAVDLVVRDIGATVVRHLPDQKRFRGTSRTRQASWFRECRFSRIKLAE